MNCLPIYSDNLLFTPIWENIEINVSQHSLILSHKGDTHG